MSNDAAHEVAAMRKEMRKYATTACVMIGMLLMLTAIQSFFVLLVMARAYR